MSTQTPTIPAQRESFLQRAQRLDRMGHTDAALDLLYDNIDEQMRQGRFADLDLVLATLHVEDYSADMLLGLLTATLPARSRLLARASLLTKVEETLRRRGKYEEGLLVGL
jgi:hypothetical protein